MSEEKTEQQPQQPPPTDAAAAVGTAASSAATPVTAADLTQLQAENEQLKREVRTAEAHRQITAELETAGARSPELLFDAVRGDLQFDDAGELANREALVERLKQRFPEQFVDRRTASIDAASGSQGSPRLTRSMLHRMPATEIAKLDWADVRRALAS